MSRARVHGQVTANLEPPPRIRELLARRAALHGSRIVYHRLTCGATRRTRRLSHKLTWHTDSEDSRVATRGLIIGVRRGATFARPRVDRRRTSTHGGIRLDEH